MDTGTMRFASVVNDPAHQTAANRRQAMLEAQHQQRLKALAQFRNQQEQKRINRLEVEACRYTVAAIAAGLGGFYATFAALWWLAAVLGVAGALLCSIACYGWGRLREAKRRA